MTLDELYAACKALSPTCAIIVHQQMQWEPSVKLDYPRWSASIHDHPAEANSCELLYGETPEEVLAKVTAYCQRDKSPAIEAAHADTERAP